jgi:hypothetical protein
MYNPDFKLGWLLDRILYLRFMVKIDPKSYVLFGNYKSVSKTYLILKKIILLSEITK